MAARLLILTALIPALLLLGCAPGAGGHKTVATSDDSGDPTVNGGSGTDKTASEPAPLSGVNLVFSVDQKKIDPATVSGYIVGAVGSLVIEPYAAATSDSNPTYVIKNVPAGNHDVIVTAGALAISAGGASALRLASATKDSGRRLKGIIFSADKTTEAGLLDLPKFGSISGVATLAGQSKYAGIDVYVPGTDMVAKTDDKGNFAISAVPVGVHDLYYDMSGYYRGQVENITATSQQNTTVAAIQLMLSTGAKGIIVISGGAAISSSRTVSLNIGATPDAVLMKISENEAFVGADWVPIITNTHYTFNSEGDKTLYIKFADANGLESTTYSDTIEVDIFGPTEGLFTINSGATYAISRTVLLSISVPINAVQMIICEDPSFTGCTAEPVASAKTHTFSTDGNKTLYVEYIDKDGFKSPSISSTILVDTTPPNTPTGLVAYGGDTKNTLRWTNGGGDTVSYLVVVKIGSAVIFVPVNGTTYTTGQDLGGDNLVRSMVTDTSYTDLNLTNGTTYYYAIFAHDAHNNYSSGLTGSSTANIASCGAAGQGCYDSFVATANGTAMTPSGKVIDYVSANGNSGFMIWREHGGNRILRANGLDEWAMMLNSNGKGQSVTAFTDANLGTSSTVIGGRVCPTNVYIDDGNKFTTNNCVYYTPEHTAQTLSVGGTDGILGLNGWNNYNSGTAKWYVGNIATCSSMGMRLPALYETTTTLTSAAYYPTDDGSPTFAQSNGVPSGSDFTWTSSSYSSNISCYVTWAGSSVNGNGNSYHGRVRCILP